MKILPNISRQANVFGDDAELAIAFHVREADKERLLLENVYAPNGDVGEGVRLARAEGVDTFTFRHYEHRLLWEIACWAKDTAAAHDMARLAQKRGEIFVIHVPHLLDSWPWCPGMITKTARELLEFAPAEREARLCRARYIALLAGTIKSHISRIAEARAA